MIYEQSIDPNNRCIDRVPGKQRNEKNVLDRQGALTLERAIWKAPAR